MKSVLIILLCLTLTSSLKSQDKNEWWENINVLNKYMQKNIDYPKVDADFPTIERKEEFLKYFLTLMDKLADNNDDLSFLKLVNFWDNHFKHDSIFREIRNIETKLSIEGVFTSFKAEINQRKQDKWKNLEKLNADEIELFEQIDKTGVSEYMKAWNEISTNIVPQNSDAFKVLTDKYDIISRIASLNQDINRTVANYINCWRQYFEVKSRSDYAGKENASREKIKALNCAMDIGGNNNFFDINSSLENLNTRISYFEDDENKWKAHRLVDTIISEFEVNTTHTLADIYTTRDAVLNAAGNTTLETELANKLQKFKDIPETITIENLEDYLTSRWNNNDNVVTILKNELKSKLEIQVGNLLKNGKRGNFARSINEVVVLENRYFDLFKGNTRWLNCINMLRGYYNEKENKNYSFVLGCYNDTACTSEISKVWFWDKAEIKDQFWSYFLNQAKIILQNERNIKTQQDFSQFKETLYIPIENIFGVEEPLKSRYSALNNYFSSKTSNETEKAARNLYTNFPKLAAAYSIKDPDEKIKLEWNAKLIDFKNDYRNVLQAIRATNLTDQDKKQKLLTITNKFVEDNPYSSEDDQMREQLKQKLANVNNKIEENKRRVEKINQDFANQLNDLNVFLNALNSNEEKKNKIEKFQSTYENNIADLTENNKNKLVQIRNTLNDINKSIEERIKLNKDFNEQLKNLNDSIKNSTSDEAKKSAIEGLLGRYKKNLELFTESNQEKFNGLEKTLNAIKESNENRQKINNEFIKKINVLEPILNSQTASDDQVKKLTDFYNEYKGEDNLFPDNKNKLTNFKNNMDSLTNKIQQAKNAIADQQKDFDQNYDSIMKLDINQEGPEAIQQVRNFINKYEKDNLNSDAKKKLADVKTRLAAMEQKIEEKALIDDYTKLNELLSNPNIASTAKKAAINKFLDTYQNKSDLSQESISKINDIIAKQTQLDNIIKEQNQTLGKPDLQMQNPPSDDFKSLTEMWKAVLNFKTEKEAIDYIKREAPLGLKNHETANNKLKGLSEWHYRWENKGEFKNGLQALFMIKEMMSYSDNINSQNDILNIMAERMKREKLNEIQIQYPWEAIPLISYSEQSISDIQKNNTNYLNFRKLWEADRNNVDKINQIDAYRNSLKMEYLSKHQEIQAHFMFGDFYEKNNSFLISLVHYYHAWKLMKEKDVTQILSLTPSPVDINKLKEKVCELWNKINEAQQSEFKEKFKSEIADDIMKLCTGEDVVPIELQNFLDLFYEYLKSLKNQTSIPQKTFDTILSKELDLAEFINLTQNKKVLPFGFNYDICRFFYYTYNWSQPGNKTKAQAIIDKIENEDTKNTLQRIFNELTY